MRIKVSYIMTNKAFFFGFIIVSLLRIAFWTIDHIRILGIGLELAWNGGSCGGISLKRD